MNNAILVEERRRLSNMQEVEWREVLKACPTDLMHNELASRAMFTEGQNATARRVLNEER